MRSQGCTNMNQRKFKYQEHIDLLVSKGCQLPLMYPPDGMHACRFAFADGGHKNHIPQYLSNPKRMLRDIESNRMNTSLLSLSCFDSSKNAERFFANLRKSVKNAASTIGDCLSEGELDNQDGMKTETSLNGHFDFYEFEGCDLNESFTITKKLVNDEKDRRI